MERKIGEIFEYNGKWYQVLGQTGKTCKDCFFYSDDGCFIQPSIGWCRHYSRNDNQSIIYKKLEKVGKPYVAYGKVRQKYKLHVPLTITNGIIERDILCDDVKEIVDIEIKQNKEDMEEKKLNLKPFSLELAKQGKSVCTRDGRKARIICFDKKCINTECLIVLVSGEVDEAIHIYTKDGKTVSGDCSDFDLMMLPEKKEGWVNLYKERIYSTKEDAVNAKYNGCTYIDTIKISWEE